MKRAIVIIQLFVLLFVACRTPPASPAPAISRATLVLTHGRLIDGTGAEPIPDATLVIAKDRILAVGPASQISLPAGVEVIDLRGATILPGFINAHVHDAYDENRLKAWAQAGVTTVRDEGIITGSRQLKNLLSLRDQWAASAQNARLVSSGYMLTVPRGYGYLYVTSAVNARQWVNMEVSAGVDLIKVTMETGYAGVTNLPVFSEEVLQTIVETAHGLGVDVSAHLTNVKFLPILLEVGVDDLAHIPIGVLSEDQIQQLIAQDVYVVPTLTVMDAYGALQDASSNLEVLNEAGVKIAMGSDYTLIPQNNFDHFELGMPMHEITAMNAAGMTPMQIIVAATRNAAHVSALEADLGTLEAGKLADILVIMADPLQDLSALLNVKMVVHNGEIIRR